eukprot:TRINITY_DN64_c0_g1_i1.p1 TRINITY_DN64_c0_g1~~TRINITY_DN64_c0_g1_i1.p1  ORF type:complete len:755 (+),score=106.65 TRINITY_DN64_c0_g1_i1:6427-8691(+)
MESTNTHENKSKKHVNVSVEPLPVHVSPEAIEEVPTVASEQRVEYCRVFLHQPPKWIPGRDSKENNASKNLSGNRDTNATESVNRVAVSMKSPSVKDRTEKRISNRSYVSSEMANRLKNAPQTEPQKKKAILSSGEKQTSSFKHTNGSTRSSQVLSVNDRFSVECVVDEPRMEQLKPSRSGKEIGATTTSAGETSTEPIASSHQESQATHGEQLLEQENKARLDEVNVQSGTDPLTLNLPRTSSNSTPSSSETTENFQRRESPSAFEYGAQGTNKSPTRGSQRSFTTAASAEDGRRYFGFRRLAKHRKPKIKMPRSIRENGVRIRSSSGSAVLPLFNASNSSIHVNIEVKKYPGSKATAITSHKMLALDSQQRMNIILTRMSSNEGHLRIIITGYLRGPVKLSTVYHVPLYVEESQNRVPAATGFAVDRPTITFYKIPSRYQYQSLRVLNGTYRAVPYKVWLGGLKDGKNAVADHVVAIMSGTEGIVEGRKCVTVRLRFDSSHPVQCYRQMLHISMDNSTDKVPIFAYTGCSSIRISLTNEGLFRAENHGNRSGFVVLSGPEIDALDNKTEKFVLQPKERKDLVAPYGSGTLIYTGDEIARSRFCRAADVIPNAKREAGEEMSLFLGTFDGEQEARRKEYLLWHRDTKHSLHYAGRLFGNNIRRYKYDPDQRRVMNDSKSSKDCGWQASIDADGYVHIENYDTQKYLNFKCKGAEPKNGAIPPLGDAKLAAFLENVEVFARGGCIELYNERRFK